MKKTSVKTVDRLVKILDCFSFERPTWSLAELCAELDLPKSTLHRFLVSLEAHGILRRDPVDVRWRLGYRLFIWGTLAEKSTGLRQVTHPVMQELVDATQETALLTVYQAQDVVCVAKVETNYPVRMTLVEGGRHPLHAGASSKVLMAYLSPNEIQSIIQDKGLPKLCSNTITDPDKLLEELAKIRQQGYARSLEETDPGAWGVAAPIYNERKDVVAAIGVAGPSSRFTDDLAQQYAALCKQAALRISTLLSWGIDPSASSGLGPSASPSGELAEPTQW